MKLFSKSSQDRSKPKEKPDYALARYPDSSWMFFEDLPPINHDEMERVKEARKESPEDWEKYKKQRFGS